MADMLQHRSTTGYQRLGKGLVLTGPPWVGRRWVAEAVATSVSLPVLESGQIETASTGPPACLILDEADAGVLTGRGIRRAGNSAGPAGGAADIRRAIFTLAGDCDAGLMVVTLTSRPDLLDPVVLRRFTVIPVLRTDMNGAAQIVQLLARWMGADAHGVNEAVKGIAVSHEACSRQDLTAAGDTVDDACKAVGEELMALLAVATASSRRLLPWVAAAISGQPYRLPTCLEPFLHADGSVDLPALNNRINELRGRHD